LRSLFVAITPAVEARSPDCRNNVENALSAAGRRRAGRARFPYAARGFGGAARRLPVAGRRRALTLPSRPFALCRHIAGLGLRASGNLPVSYVLTGNLPVTYHQ